MKTKKYLLGTMIKEWDDRESQTVEDFNDFFDEVLPFGKKNARVEIGAPYTHNGRLIKVEGVEGEIQFLFSTRYNTLSKKRVVYKIYIEDSLRSTHSNLEELCIVYKFSKQTAYKILNKNYQGLRYGNYEIIKEERTDI